MFPSLPSDPINDVSYRSCLTENCSYPYPSSSPVAKQLNVVHNSSPLVDRMTIKEKIGQKIMLDFRQWNETNQTGGLQDLVRLTGTIKKILRDYHIGGIILFSNNLKDREQIINLTDSLNEIVDSNKFRLFIAVDNEGGNVFRLPRGEYCSFAGNMALGAALEGAPENNLAYQQGCIMAGDLRSLGINTNFAPVMDVNVNQNNPVINVRSFGDSPPKVALLARQMIAGISNGHIVSAAKHFPGHGDTVIDSHLDLPKVNHNRQQAYDIDLQPYREAIRSNKAPDMIMTAHIQYPSLDDSLIKNKAGEDIIRPATLSKTIQTNILRDEFGYNGVTITDALDMKAISDNFEIDTVMELVFNAGVDIALMPVSIRSPADRHKLESVINTLADKIDAGIIDNKAVSDSVNRIIELKEKREIKDGIVNNQERPRYDLRRRVEKDISDASVTLLKNKDCLLPLRDKNQPLYILMPWDEQNQAIEHTLTENGFCSVRYGKISDIPWHLQQQEIDCCAVLIIGSLTIRAKPGESPDESATPGGSAQPKVDDQQRAMDYARHRNKKIVHISLLAPYDVITYDNQSDAALATYSCYGMENGGQRGQSLISATEIIIGKLPPRGKVPVNIYNIDRQGIPTTLRYPRGFGLTKIL